MKEESGGCGTLICTILSACFMGLVWGIILNTAGEAKNNTETIIEKIDSISVQIDSIKAQNDSLKNEIVLLNEYLYD